MRVRSWVLALVCVMGLFPAVRAEETVTLRGEIRRGRPAPRPDSRRSFRLDDRAGSQGQGGEETRSRRGQALDYEEAILAVDSGKVSKTVCSYEKLDFRRTLAGQAQQPILRPGVRRLVILRRGIRRCRSRRMGR